MIQNVSTRSILYNFLDRVNYNNLNVLPYNNNENILAAHARNGRKTTILTGKYLMNRNVEREAYKLRLRLHHRHIINLATEVIWNLRFTQTQRQRFITLADSANSINQNITRVNNDDTLDRIARINVPQTTTNSFERDFFNGGSF